MQISRIYNIYFSATGTTEKVTSTIAKCLSETCEVPSSIYDFTLPEARKSFPELSEKDLVVFGCPTYAGRLPNLLLPYLREVKGNGALAIPVVTFGNRAFDNSLAELTELLENGGFHTVAAGAFCCEHSFSDTLGGGRPDAADLFEAQSFALSVFGKLVRSAAQAEAAYPVHPTGDPGAPYYQPRDRHGNPIDIRKVKPVTAAACTNCGLCASICPMGAIDPADVTSTPGICIKCCACTKKCPTGAKHFEDPGFLYHKTELEAMYGDARQPNTFFLD